MSYSFGDYEFLEDSCSKLQQYPPLEHKLYSLSRICVSHIGYTGQYSPPEHKLYTWSNLTGSSGTEFNLR